MPAGFLAMFGGGAAGGATAGGAAAAGTGAATTAAAQAAVPAATAASTAGAAAAPSAGLSGLLTQAGQQITGGLKGLLGIGENVSGGASGAMKGALEGVPAGTPMTAGEQAALAAVNPMDIPVGGAAQVVEGGKVAMLDKGALGGFDAAGKMSALKGEAEALAAKAEKFQAIQNLLLGGGGKEGPTLPPAARGRARRPKTEAPQVEVVNRKDQELQQLIAMILGGQQ